MQKQCEVKRTRASGPGGQHRNKVETAIVITHLPTGVVGQASEKRSQHANLIAATTRLRMQLALEVRSQPLPEEPNALWLSRVKNRQIKVNLAHPDYPKLLTLALDVLKKHDLKIAVAAEVLQVSTSQLIKFLKSGSAAWEHVQQHRKRAGLKTLK